MAGRTNEPPSKKQEKIALTGSAETLRLTANIGAYWAFMKRLAPKIRQWHRDAYCGSIFQHYILFGAPAADRPTLELLLSFFDRDNNTFCIPDCFQRKLLSSLRRLKYSPYGHHGQGSEHYPKQITIQRALSFGELSKERVFLLSQNILNELLPFLEISS
ncbi:uncharacterized protein LOC109824104 [Asparagus officinalis]|uniref:uncharacterized protein LOC109824104 n=1 Tax=Asparagus officinalis TaxID=4686 RepID=UPI00098E6B77|nr:uncharacterized protein LOC109824104 [Asparagus officinalis]